jgi:hypothetical protein
MKCRALSPFAYGKYGEIIMNPGLKQKGFLAKLLIVVILPLAASCDNGGGSSGGSGGG